MDEHLLSLAVPFFVVTMIAEALVAKRTRRRVYRLHDTIASLGCGIGQTLLGFWLNLVVIAVYAYVARFSPFALSRSSPAVWVGSLVGVDFCHYWFHRSSHRVNFLWAGHAVHHQSEEYNLSTALRQSWLEPWMSIPFYLPLALAGVPVEVFLVTHTVQVLYQYWIHTRLIGRLGPLDWIFNTPTHHRVHHAINPEYIDKNYAGIFILWDRLFGTFVGETSEPAYGVVKPLASFDPLWANLAEWARIAALAYGSKTRSEALYAPIAPPEWMPRAMGGPKEVPPVDRARRLFDTSPGRLVDRYVAVAFAIVLGGSGALLRFARSLELAVRLAWVGWFLTALVTFAALMHAKRWGAPAEKVRLALAPALGAITFGPWGIAGGALFAVASAWGVSRATRRRG